MPILHFISIMIKRVHILPLRKSAMVTIVFILLSWMMMRCFSCCSIVHFNHQRVAGLAASGGIASTQSLYNYRRFTVFTKTGYVRCIVFNLSHVNIESWISGEDR